MIAAVIFDLDETLVLEDRPVEHAFEATARHAAEFHELVIAELVAGARARARELWWAATTGEYCRRVGFASWEGLWCRFEGDDDQSRGLVAGNLDVERKVDRREEGCLLDLRQDHRRPDKPQFRQ